MNQIMIFQWVRKPGVHECVTAGKRTICSYRNWHILVNPCPKLAVTSSASQSPSVCFALGSVTNMFTWGIHTLLLGNTEMRSMSSVITLPWINPWQQFHVCYIIMLTIIFRYPLHTWGTQYIFVVWIIKCLFKHIFIFKSKRSYFHYALLPYRKRSYPWPEVLINMRKNRDFQASQDEFIVSLE
jgi:hypothetical protein